MHAKDVMTTAGVTARPQTSVERIAKLMLGRRISAVPVARFFFVILSQAALFTEFNVVMPTTLLHCSKATVEAKSA